MNKRRIGTAYESIAVKYLEDKGYEILERNYRNRFGEIDVIAREEEYLVFVEVKYRSTKDCGSPFDAVDFRKQKRIVGVARHYLLMHGLSESVNLRFDVVAVSGEEIELLKNAFEAG